MAVNQVAFLLRKEPCILTIRQHSKKGLHMRDFAAEIVCNAHRSSGVGFYQRLTLRWSSDNVADQHPPVQQIDLLPFRREPLPVEFQLSRIGHHDRNTHLFKSLL